MGTTLTGTKPKDTYDSLIKVEDNGPLSGTAKYLSDGLGNDSALALSTARVGVGTASPVVDFQVNGAAEVTQAFSVAGTRYLQIYTDGTIGTINGLNSAPLVFSTSTGTSFAERMRITAAGNVGIGISAPAVKLDVVGDIRTSTGILFGSDTAAANALDDYEEGTFTAILTPSTSGTITLSANTCTYTKIGRQVTVKGFLTISSVASPVGASVDIGGLPFTIVNSTSGRGTFSFVVLDASVGYTAFTGPTQHTANSTSIIAYYDASTLAASDEIMFTATYFV